MTRALGKTQKDVLEWMAVDHRGFWHTYCGWTWNTDAGTRRIMESLARRGLVERETFRTGMGAAPGFRLTAAGLKAGRQS